MLNAGVPFADEEAAFAEAVIASSESFSRTIPGFVQLPPFFWWYSSHILVRRCYIKMWDYLRRRKAQDQRFMGAVVSGNPGDGKTHFLLWVLTM